MFQTLVFTTGIKKNQIYNLHKAQTHVEEMEIKNGTRLNKNCNNHKAIALCYSQIFRQQPNIRKVKLKFD